MPEYRVSRIEIIDHTGTVAAEHARAYLKRTPESFLVEIVEQDEGRTLKVFLRAGPDT